MKFYEVFLFQKNKVEESKNLAHESYDKTDKTISNVSDSVNSGWDHAKSATTDAGEDQHTFNTIY